MGELTVIILIMLIFGGIFSFKWIFDFRYKANRLQTEREKLQCFKAFIKLNKAYYYFKTRISKPIKKDACSGNDCTIDIESGNSEIIESGNSEIIESGNSEIIESGNSEIGIEIDNSFNRLLFLTENINSQTGALTETKQENQTTRHVHFKDEL